MKLEIENISLNLDNDRILDSLSLTVKEEEIISIIGPSASGKSSLLRVIAGFENISIMDIANLVKSKVGAEVIVTESNDPRSYRQDSTKLLNTGFTPKFGVNDAINELVAKYQRGDLIEQDTNYTVKTMKTLIELGEL